MATSSLLRAAGGLRLMQIAGPQILRKTTPAASNALIQKKTLFNSPVRSARVYGPSVEPLPETTSHWKMERLLNAVMIPVIPASLIFPNPALDYLVTCTICLHAHWGLAGVFGDYIHTSTKYGTLLPKIAKTTVTAISIMAFGGLIYLNYHDVGFGTAVRMLYTTNL